MDWVLYILMICLVGLVTFGLILLLFAEIFKGGRKEKKPAVKYPKKANHGVTKEERLSLTPPPPPKPFLSGSSERLRWRNSTTEEAGRNGERPLSRSDRSEPRERSR